MKILILSPYTNAVLRSHLQLRRYGKISSFFLNRFQLISRMKILDKASWVGDFIAELEKQDGIEIISVAPQTGMTKGIESFKHKKTTYYFYSSDFSQAARLVRNYTLWKKLETCSQRVKKIVEQCKPDIIVLFGTENPTISAPILSLTHYPVFCILQTVYHKPDRSKYGKQDNLIMHLEEEIANTINYFGASNIELYDLIKQLNPNLTVLEYKWIRGTLPEFPSTPKKYDFVNFAFNMDARKGDEDSIRALAIVKKKYDDVTLNIAGGMSDQRKEYIEELVSNLGLQKNVIFTPMFERKEDMLKHVLQARFAVLPVKLDSVSNTTREAMFYQLPVVTNITSGTPFLNKEKQCVLLAEKDNINNLAQHMLDLLGNEQLANRLKGNAYGLIKKQMDNTDRMSALMQDLNAIIDNYNNRVKIPCDILFDKSNHVL